ncbi:MAG: outer membrane beta-barrel protein [Ignavibacteriae bacterium]|nr:outer membrane beta-barrel protein [Ignavibacteriota bacterium]
MKPFLYLIIFSIIVSSNYAQDSCTVENPHGLQFQIGSNFQLINFDGYTISYRYFWDKNNGLRFGFLFNTYNSDGSGSEIQEYDYSDHNEALTTKENHSLGFGLSIQYHKLVYNKKNVNFLVGIGPFVYFSKLDETNKRNYTNHTYRETIINRNDTQRFGINGIVGAEYKFSEDFSLSVEVGLLMQYFINDNNYSYKTTTVTEFATTSFITERESEDDGFEIKGAPVRMGLTLFF